MKDISIDEVKEFIEFKGGSVSVQELTRYLRETDNVTTFIPERYNQAGLDPELFPIDTELFDKFQKATAHMPNEILSASEFEKRLNNLNIDFYRLKESHVLKTNARMSGIVICRKTGKRQFIRDYFVKNVPLDYQRVLKTNFPPYNNSQAASPIPKRGRPQKNKN